ncbi:MAG: ASKHA domain-containing protein [Planctomycetota bacterium]|jgi:uncharacterized 2Fe-2S/4Fe-4S cluster protein (DUF4445 family)
MKHFKITFEPDGKEVIIHHGATILEAAGQAGIILNTVCGGKGTCGKCAVELQPDGHKVQACQYSIDSDLTIIIPSQSRFFRQKILAEGLDSKFSIKPDIFERYQKKTQDGLVFGLAVDIGTTTIVSKLVDMANGNCPATETDINPQIKYGDDVVSRISYAKTDEKLTQLHNMVIQCLNKLIAKLCSKISIGTESVYEAAVVGNTTMNHIFLKLPIRQLGQAPYRAHCVDARDISADGFGLDINPAGNIHMVENIAGFVGSDTVAVGLAVDIDSAEEMTLVVDIGTNGEIILGTKEKLYAASCAAGPALEGARISQGSRAMEAAVEAVVINGNDIDLDVICGGEPRTICGSGLIDAVAVLLNLGVIDSTGRFVESDKLKGKLSSAIFSRIITQNSQPAFCLAYNNSQPGLVLTQKDIREVQLAKAAIRAGIRLLQKKLGITDNDIKHILLAGAFGNYIRKESALRIGLCPDVAPERIHFVGNAAGSGAEMVLLTSKAREMAKKLARKIEYIEIAYEREFATVYADCMMF